MSKTIKQIEKITSSEYKYGFTTDIKEDRIPIGLNEDISNATALIPNSELGHIAPPTALA